VREGGLVDVAMSLVGVSIILDGYGVNAACYFNRFCNVKFVTLISKTIPALRQKLRFPLLFTSIIFHRYSIQLFPVDKFSTPLLATVWKYVGLSLQRTLKFTLPPELGNLLPNSMQLIPRIPRPIRLILNPHLMHGGNSPKR